MKKENLFIIIGGVLLVIGVLLLTLQKEKTVIYTYVEEKLTKDEAINLIKDKAKIVVDIFENKDNVFETEIVEDSPYLLIKNYKEVIGNIYTENGIVELENTTFGEEKFLQIMDDNIYMLKEIPTYNSYIKSSISVEITSIQLKEISGKVSFSSNGVDDNGILTYYVYEKNIKLIKKDDKWLIDTLKYNN